MKKLVLFIMVGVQLFLSALLYSQSITVHTPYKGTVHTSPESIKNIVQQNSQKLKLANNIVKVYYTISSEKFIIVKLSRFTYSVSFALIKTDGNFFTIIDPNFIPKENDFELYMKPDGLSKLLTESTDFLFDTPCDDITSAVNAINTVSGYAEDQNYSVIKLVGSSASVSAIQSGITNNDLIGMGNVGHGSEYGVQLDNGFLSHTWFGSQDLSNEIFYFNSCEVFNEPFISSMLDDGNARTFIGGVLPLPIGTSEEVFMDFWDYTLNNGWEMGDALEQAEINNNLENYHGIGGDIGILMNFTTSGTLSNNETWRREVTLTGNVTVPSGITLTFASGCSVNFNGYRIIVNGSVSGESNINCAYLKQSGGTLKGLYPTAQYAINYASASDIVELQARTYSENISMKSGVSVYGGSWDKTSTVINGTVTFSSVSSATLGYVTVNSYIQNTYGGSNDIFNVLAKGPIYYSYNTYSDIEEVDMLESNSYGISAGYSTLYPWYNNIKNKSTAGINADHSTIINESNTFCNNTLDVRSNYWSDYINLYGCYFSNSTPGSTVSGPGTFYWDYWYAANCGSPKLSSTNDIIGEELKSSLENLSNDKKILGSDDYKKAKDSYKTLLSKIAKENRKKVIDFKNYETELNYIILQFRELIKTYPGSVTSFNSLQVVLDCYRCLGKDEEGKNIVNELLADKTFGEITPNIKLLSLPLIINDQNYDEALSLCDEVIEDIPNSSEAVFMLYNKGVIYETLKKDKISAVNTFGELMEMYPNSIYGDFASKYLGKENNKELVANKQMVKDFECSNFPNPFNPSTTISYTLPEKSFVTLKIFDVLGREVATLVNGIKESGEHKATFNASNLPSGVYIYSIQAGTYSAVKKMLLVK